MVKKYEMVFRTIGTWYQKLFQCVIKVNNIKYDSIINQSIIDSMLYVIFCERITVIYIYNKYCYYLVYKQTN